jgi:hypothetical protein
MRCEGYRKYGNFMTLGPREWKQCENESIVMIRFECDGKEQTLPACAECWKDCIDTKLHILEVTPIIEIGGEK